MVSMGPRTVFAFAMVLAFNSVDCGCGAPGPAGMDGGDTLEGDAVDLADSQDVPTVDRPDAVGDAGGCADTRLTPCSGSCVDTQSDPANCGGCGAACTGTTAVCQAGACRSGCTGRLTNCAGACVDTTSDPAHCGDCAVSCASGGVCVASTCACTGTEVVCGGACVDTQTDPAHCGDCATSCPTGFCIGGACGCPTTLTACGFACVDLQTDPTNCGGCGTTCGGAAPTCSGGRCASGSIGDVACGMAVCSGGQGCCTPSDGTAPSCTAEAGCGPMFTRSFAACDGPEDCASGEACCDPYPELYVAQCLSPSDPNCRMTFCHDASDCPIGTQCCPTTWGWTSVRRCWGDVVCP